MREREREMENGGVSSYGNKIFMELCKARKCGMETERKGLALGEFYKQRTYHHALHVLFSRKLYEGTTVGNISAMGKGMRYIHPIEEGKSRKPVWICPVS